MKRVGGLFENLTDRQNLVRAAHRAALGKRDRGEVRSFFARYDVELRDMSERLRHGEYRFAPYQTFAVRDTKTRTIHAPVFRDRVVHHAIINATGATFERGALEHSYACRKGRGQHAALRQAALWTRRADWYGKLDVEKFYDSIDHEVLTRLLGRRFREQRLLNLFDRLLASYESAPGKGLPIGALTSQYLGNFYLDEFDRRMKATGFAHRYVRYMDDVVVWGDQVSLRKIRNHATDALEALGLRLKNNGEWNRCVRGIPFLGFIVYPDRVRLGRQGRRRLRRKFHATEKAFCAERLDEDELCARVTALFAHAQHGDDVAWRRTVVSFSRYVGNEGETQEPRPRRAGRVLEQQGQELPVRDPQQEQGRQPQQEPRVPGLSGSRHGEHEQQLASPDVASSRSRRLKRRDKSSGKTSADSFFPRPQQRAEEPLSAEAPPEPPANQPPEPQAESPIESSRGDDAPF